MPSNATKDQLTIIAKIRAKAGMELRLREALLALVAPTRAESGCINYDLHVARDNPREFVFYENWRSPADLDAHFKTPHMVAFFKNAHEMLDGEADIARWTMLRGA